MRCFGSAKLVNWAQRADDGAAGADVEVEEEGMEKEQVPAVGAAVGYVDELSDGGLVSRGMGVLPEGAVSE